jgi:hypothetical protein
MYWPVVRRAPQPYYDLAFPVIEKRRGDRLRSLCLPWSVIREEQECNANLDLAGFTDLLDASKKMEYRLLFDGRLALPSRHMNGPEMLCAIDRSWPNSEFRR